MGYSLIEKTAGTWRWRNGCWAQKWSQSWAENLVVNGNRLLHFSVFD